MNDRKDKCFRAYLDLMHRVYDDSLSALEQLCQHWEEGWQLHELDLKRYFGARSNFFTSNTSVPSK